MAQETMTPRFSSRKKAAFMKAVREGLDSANQKELVAHELVAPLFLERRINTLRLMERRRK